MTPLLNNLESKQQKKYIVYVFFFKANFYALDFLILTKMNVSSFTG